MFCPTQRPFVVSAHPRCHRRAFTLIELLTVIAIIGILAAIMIPVVGRVRDSARSAQCTSNLRQVFNLYMLEVQNCRGFTPPDVVNGQGISLINRLAAANYNFSVEGKGIQQAMSCPMQLTLKPGVAISAAQNNYPPITFSLNRGLNRTLANPSTPPTTRAIAAIGAPSRMVLAGDGNDGDQAANYYGPVIGIGRPPSTPHRGRANIVFLDGHVSAVSDPALLNVTSVAAGTPQAAFWFGE